LLRVVIYRVEVDIPIIGGLQTKVISENESINVKINNLTKEWEKDKPVQGDIRPENAVKSLSSFETRSTKLKDEHDIVCQAREALDLDFSTNNRLEPILEELTDLKSVWIEISKMWNELNEIKESLWISISPRKIKQSLDDLIMKLKELPSRMKQYGAYEYLHESLKGLLKMNVLVFELKSESLRDRHWRQLLKILKLDGAISYNLLTM
jgi:dynein heavy chain 1, cytosolic